MKNPIILCTNIAGPVREVIFKNSPFYIYPLTQFPLREDVQGKGCSMPLQCLHSALKVLQGGTDKKPAVSIINIK